MNATQHAMTSNDIMKGALLGGVINAVINGTIQYFILRGNEGPFPISVDAIGSDTHKVLGSSVPLAVSLAMVLTAVAHWTLEAPKKWFIPTALWLVIKHGLFAFGTSVAVAVVWQRAFGTIKLGLGTAMIFLGIIAGVVAATVNYMTMTQIRETD